MFVVASYSTELILRVPTSRVSDVFAHIKSGATHCYVFIISSHEHVYVTFVYIGPQFS